MKFRPTDFFTLFVGIVILGAIIVAWDWPLRASIIVLVLGSVGFVMVMVQLILDVRGNQGNTEAPELAFEIPSFVSDDPITQRNGVLEIWGWLIALLLAVFLIGLPLSLALFVFLYTKLYGGGWPVSLGMAGAIAVFEYGVYDRIMHVYWPESLLWQLFE